MTKLSTATPAPVATPTTPTSPAKPPFVRRKAVTVLPVSRLLHLYTGKVYSLNPEWVDEHDFDDYFRTQLEAGKVAYVPD